MQAYNAKLERKLYYFFQSLIPVKPQRQTAEIPGGEAEAFITPNAGT